MHLNTSCPDRGCGTKLPWGPKPLLLLVHSNWTFYHRPASSKQKYFLTLRKSMTAQWFSLDRGLKSLTLRLPGTDHDDGCEALLSR